MDKKIKIFLSFVAIMIFLGVVAGYFFLKNSPTAQPSTDTIFFYGRECPHCQDVEKFLADNKIADKIKYDSVEVWHNSDNAKLMAQKAKDCGLADKQIGVPLVWSQGKCYVGTPDVEAFFRQKAAI